MIVELILVIMSIPIGFLIAYLTRDELKSGKQWFRVVMIGSFALAIWSFLQKDFHIVWTGSFIFIVALVSLIKAENKKWISNEKE